MYPLALPSWVMLRSGYWVDRAAMANHADDLYRRQVRPSAPAPDVWALLGQHPSHFVNEMLMERLRLLGELPDRRRHPIRRLIGRLRATRVRLSRGSIEDRVETEPRRTRAVS